MLERGFKSWAENAARQFRHDLKLSDFAPLDPRQVVTLLSVRLLTPGDVPGLSNEDKEILLGRESSCWHAVTVYTDGTDLVIYNPRHSVARRNSDIMHELSHLIIGHAPSQLFVDPERSIALREYNGNQEEEANWLAYTLLLPRPALLYIGSKGLPVQRARELYGVSRDLLLFRMQITAVDRQLGRARRFRTIARNSRR